MLIFLNQICILASFNDVLTISVRFESPLHFTENVLFATTSYTKMFGSDERLIQFWLSLYLVLLFTRTPFKLISEQFTCILNFFINKNIYLDICLKIIIKSMVLNSEHGLYNQYCVNDEIINWNSIQRPSFWFI